MSVLGVVMNVSGFRLLICTALLLSACGGGGGGNSTASNGTNSGTTSGTDSNNTTISYSESSRTINSECPLTQTLLTDGSRADGMRIDDISWLQTVQLDPDHADTRMVAGKAIKLRVDLLADTNPLSPLQRVARIYDPATGSCTDLTLSGPSRVPATSNVESITATAYSVTIPSNLVKPGMSVSVLFNDSTGRSAAEADETYRVLRPAIAAAVTETVRVIPIKLSTKQGSFSSPQDLSNLLTRLYPVTTVNVVETAPYVISLSLIDTLTLLDGTYVGTIGQMQNLLSLIDDYCLSLNGGSSNARTAPKCIGLLPSNLIFRPVGSTTSQVVGLAYVGGVTMISRSVDVVDTSTSSPYVSNHWISFDAMTVAHEYGHLLNLDHANCGSPSMLDSRLYSDGRLGDGAGWDAIRDVYFSSQRLLNGQPQFADVMSYCGKEWMSDRGYLATLGYRSGAAYISGRVDGQEAESGQWLKLSLHPEGWKVSKVGFAPATLRKTDLTLTVESDQGMSDLGLRSAMVSEHDVTDNFGPFYVNVGQRKPHQFRVKNKGMELARFPMNKK